MQMNQEAAVIPEWTLGDRLRKAREHAGLSQMQMYAETGIARSSIVRYENGQAVPSRAMLLSWALSTGVDLGWLLSGGEIIVRCSRPPLPALLTLASCPGCGASPDDDRHREDCPVGCPRCGSTEHVRCYPAPVEYRTTRAALGLAA